MRLSKFTHCGTACNFQKGYSHNFCSLKIHIFSSSFSSGESPYCPYTNIFVILVPYQLKMLWRNGTYECNPMHRDIILFILEGHSYTYSEEIFLKLFWAGRLYLSNNFSTLPCRPKNVAFFWEKILYQMPDRWEKNKFLPFMHTYDP